MHDKFLMKEWWFTSSVNFSKWIWKLFIISPWFFSYLDSLCGMVVLLTFYQMTKDAAYCLQTHLCFPFPTNPCSQICTTYSIIFSFLTDILPYLRSKRKASWEVSRKNKVLSFCPSWWDVLSIFREGCLTSQESLEKISQVNNGQQLR